MFGVMERTLLTLHNFFSSRSFVPFCMRNARTSEKKTNAINSKKKEPNLWRHIRKRLPFVSAVANSKWTWRTKGATNEQPRNKKHATKWKLSTCIAWTWIGNARMGYLPISERIKIAERRTRNMEMNETRGRQREREKIKSKNFLSQDVKTNITTKKVYKISLKWHERPLNKHNKINTTTTWQTLRPSNVVAAAIGSLSVIHARSQIRIESAPK